MQQTFYITGTNTGVGKTVLTALLASHLRINGSRVAAFKPLCSGGRNDARMLHNALDGTMPLNEINPWHFRAPVAPSLAAQREKKRVKLSDVLCHLRNRRKKSETTLVEGAGGLLSPLGENFDSRDLMIALRAVPIIVAPNKLGVVNHLLLTLEALPKRLLANAGIVLMTPARSDSATSSNTTLLAQFFPPERTFTLPYLGKRIDPARLAGIPRIRNVLNELIRLR